MVYSNNFNLLKNYISNVTQKLIRIFTSHIKLRNHSINSIFKIHQSNKLIFSSKINYTFSTNNSTKKFKFR